MITNVFRNAEDRKYIGIEIEVYENYQLISFRICTFYHTHSSRFLQFHDAPSSTQQLSTTPVVSVSDNDTQNTSNNQVSSFFLTNAYFVNCTSISIWILRHWRLANGHCYSYAVWNLGHDPDLNDLTLKITFSKQFCISFYLELNDKK